MVHLMVQPSLQAVPGCRPVSRNLSWWNICWLPVPLLPAPSLYLQNISYDAKILQATFLTSQNSKRHDRVWTCTVCMWATHRAWTGFARSGSVRSWKPSVTYALSDDVWKRCGRNSSLLNRPSTRSHRWSHFHGNEEDEWKRDGGQTTYRPSDISWDGESARVQADRFIVDCVSK